MRFNRPVKLGSYLHNRAAVEWEPNSLGDAVRFEWRLT